MGWDPDDEMKLEIDIDGSPRKRPVKSPQSMSVVHTFKDTENETLRAVGGRFIEDRDGDAVQTWMDKMSYVLENAIAANSNLRFLMLFVVTSFLAMILGLCMMEREEYHFKEKVLHCCDLATIVLQ